MKTLYYNPSCYLHFPAIIACCDSITFRPYCDSWCAFMSSVSHYMEIMLLSFLQQREQRANIFHESSTSTFFSAKHSARMSLWDQVCYWGALYIEPHSRVFLGIIPTACAFCSNNTWLFAYRAHSEASPFLLTWPSKLSCPGLSSPAGQHGQFLNVFISVCHWVFPASIQSLIHQ